jgi:histidine ammonia-lyase
VVLDAVVLDGRHLTADAIARVAAGAPVRLAASGRQRAADAAAAVRAVLASGRPVYGHATGVGANRSVDVPLSDAAAHGRRLLASHAVAVGPPLPPAVVRAALAVRINQLAAGGSGARPEVLDALVALCDGEPPLVHDGAAIGTGDLSALAEVGSAVAATVALDGGDAVALLSSNAVTVARATLATLALERWARASVVVAALSLRAVDGSVEPFAAAVSDAHPLAGAAEAAALVRAVTADTRSWPAVRLQDPDAWRALAAVSGPVLAGSEGLLRHLEIEGNAAAENPLVVRAPPAVLHHGGFQLVQVAIDLDAARLALSQAAALSAARLAHLMDPAISGLAPFLAKEADGSSGALALEYAAQAALAHVRHAAQPVTIASASLSLGVEDHAPFASHGAALLAETVAAASEVVGCELVAGVRALRLRGVTPDGRLGVALALAGGGQDAAMEDRPLQGDVRAGVAALEGLSELSLG